MIENVTRENRWDGLDDDALIDEAATYTHGPIPQTPPLGLVIEMMRRLERRVTQIERLTPGELVSDDDLAGPESDRVVSDADIRLAADSATLSLADPDLPDAQFIARARALFAKHRWLPRRVVESALNRLAVRCWAHMAPGVNPAILARVLEATPVGLDPMEVEGFLSTPNPNLIIDDRIVTAAEFLAAGGDTDVVVHLARDLDWW